MPKELRRCRYVSGRKRSKSLQGPSGSVSAGGHDSALQLRDLFDCRSKERVEVVGAMAAGDERSDESVASLEPFRVIVV